MWYLRKIKDYKDTVNGNLSLQSLTRLFKFISLSYFTENINLFIYYIVIFELTNVWNFRMFKIMTVFLDVVTHLDVYFLLVWAMSRRCFVLIEKKLSFINVCFFWEKNVAILYSKNSAIMQL